MTYLALPTVTARTVTARTVTARTVKARTVTAALTAAVTQCVAAAGKQLPQQRAYALSKWILRTPRTVAARTVAAATTATAHAIITLRIDLTTVTHAMAP